MQKQKDSRFHRLIFSCTPNSAAFTQVTKLQSRESTEAYWCKKTSKKNKKKKHNWGQLIFDWHERMFHKAPSWLLVHFLFFTAGVNAEFSRKRIHMDFTWNAFPNVNWRTLSSLLNSGLPQPNLSHMGLDQLIMETRLYALLPSLSLNVMTWYLCPFVKCVIRLPSIFSIYLFASVQLLRPQSQWCHLKLIFKMETLMCILVWCNINWRVTELLLWLQLHKLSKFWGIDSTRPQKVWRGISTNMQQILQVL